MIEKKTADWLGPSRLKTVVHKCVSANNRPGAQPSPIRLLLTWQIPLTWWLCVPLEHHHSKTKCQQSQKESPPAYTVHVIRCCTYVSTVSDDIIALYICNPRLFTIIFDCTTAYFFKCLLQRSALCSSNSSFIYLLFTFRAGFRRSL